MRARWRKAWPYVLAVGFLVVCLVAFLPIVHCYGPFPFGSRRLQICGAWLSGHPPDSLIPQGVTYSGGTGPGNYYDDHRSWRIGSYWFVIHTYNKEQDDPPPRTSEP